MPSFIRKTLFLFSGCSVMIVITMNVLAETQGLYHWIDEQGNEQFTQTPPPPNAKHVDQKTLRIQPNLGSTAAATAEKTPAEISETEADKETEENSEEQMKARKEESCKAAKKELDMLSTAKIENFAVTDPKDPNKVIPLTEEIRKKRVATAQAYYNTYCNAQTSE